MPEFQIPPDLDQNAIEQIRCINEALDRLAAKRVERILVEGPLAQSKLAWNVATYRQALLYRVVALARGCANSWNEGDVLGTALASRAVLMDFTRRLETLLDQGDFAGIKKLIMNQTLFTRMDEWVKQYPESRATNATTIIDRVEKKEDFGGAMTGYYADLSELSHPNYGGLLGLFGKINTETGETTYSDQREPNYRLVLGAMLHISVAEDAFERLDRAIVPLADSSIV